MGLQPPKSRKIVIFGINLPLKENSRGRQKKLNIGAQLQPTLPLCNNTIIVLKITLLHSVSVITNFVIPKRDKQTDRQTDRQKHHTFSSTAGARPRIPTILDMVIEEVRTIFAPLTFLIRSVVSPLGATENLWENAPLWKNGYIMVDCPPKATKLKKLIST